MASNEENVSIWWRHHVGAKRVPMKNSQWTEFGKNITQINKFCMDEILFELSAVICLHF